MQPIVATLCALLLAAVAHGADHKLTKLWETDAALKVPESVRFDARRKVLYVSNIDGPPWEADGKGSIAKVGLDGSIIAAEWVTGLHGPKGLALSDDGRWLFAADMGGIVVIDIERSKIDHKIAIPEGVQLNDLVNDRGTLYVSDSKGRKVFAVKDGHVSVFLDETVLKGPNGLFVHRHSLYVLDDNGLNRVKRDRSLEVLATDMTGGADGLESVGGNDFLVSVWSGAMWFVPAKGDKQLVFDGKPTGTRTADIGWDPRTRTVFAPTFSGNTVIAFRLD